MSNLVVGEPIISRFSEFLAFGNFGNLFQSCGVVLSRFIETKQRAKYFGRKKQENLENKKNTRNKNHGNNEEKALR